MGSASRAFGICHGGSGSRIIGYLEDYKLEVAFIHRDGAESRTNYLFVESNNDCTIVAEKGVPLVEDDLDELVASLKARTAPGDYLVLSGDAGNCANPFVYNDILAELRNRDLRVFVDTSGPALAKCLESAPFLIKPNLSELSSLCGRKVRCELDDLRDALDSLERYGVEIVAVSLGSAGSIVNCPQGLFKAVPPPVAVRNTIGCGDCFLAGLVYGISEGKAMDETLALATAASAATAESSLSVGFDPDRARELVARCEVRKIR
jgi:1-phosphofructokinase family hexose kinase